MCYSPKRAGVDQQLISYYFDGKAGLYRALSDRWRSISANLNQAGLRTHEVVGNYVRSNREQRSWARLLAWQGLTGDEEQPDESADTFFTAMVDDVRRRQEAGTWPPTSTLRTCS